MKMTFSVLILIIMITSFKVFAVTIDNYPHLGIIVTTTNSSEKILLSNLNSLKDHPKFDKNLKTILYCFGYTQYFSEITVQTIMKAYQTRGGFNFLVVDWADYNSGDYLELRKDVSAIGALVGRKLYELQIESNDTINIANWHLIGHSMGSHLIAFVARSITLASQLNKVRVAHLTALDPAGTFSSTCKTNVQSKFKYLLSQVLGIMIPSVT
jgi:ammonia channel protein AmtB